MIDHVIMQVLLREALDHAGNSMILMRRTWVPMTPIVSFAPHGMAALRHGWFVTTLLRLAPLLLPTF